MSGMDLKFSANVKALVWAVVLFCITSVFAFYAMQQDYGLYLEIEADTSEIGSDFCAIAYIYAGDRHNSMVADIIANQISFKMPSSTRAFKAVSVLYGKKPDKRLIDNDFIDHNYIGRVTVNGIVVENDDLLGAFAKARAGLQTRFFIFAVVLGLFTAGLAYTGFYFYRKKAQVNQAISGAMHRWGRKLSNINVLFYNKKFRFIFLLLLAIVILIWRRPGQFFHPYIFAEDATYILDQYMLDGWKSVFYQVNGYCILISRIISILAIKISFWYYVELAAFFTNLFIILVVFAIAYAPTHLKRPYLCAIMTLLLKTGSECFGVPLYSFWWAGLLLVLAVMWQSDKKPALRFLFILLGGFSSPMVFVATPLLVFLAAYKRKSNDIAAAVAALIPCVFQAVVVLTFDVNSHGTISIQMLSGIVRNILGTYTLLPTHSYWLLLLGGILMTIILIGHLKFPRWSLKSFIDGNLYYLMLLAWLGGALLTSIYRADWAFVEREPLGFFEHRYFFYPFIFLAWLNIWIIAELPNLYPKIILKIFMVLILFNFIFGGAYRDMPMDQPYFNWREQLALCFYGEQRGYLTIVNKRFYAIMEIPREGLIGMIQDSWFFNDVEANLHKLNLTEQ